MLFVFVRTSTSDKGNDFHRGMYRYVLDNPRIKAVVIDADW